MKKLLLFISLVFITVNLFAQDNGAYDRIKKLFYEDYEYEKVIQLSNELISSKDLDDTKKIDLYLMRAVSFYAFDNNAQARLNFENILRINKAFSPDVTKVSSKVIVFFNEVKTEFLRANPEQATTPEDVAKIISLAAEKEALVKNASVKNLFVPGWGQFTLGSTSKGIAFSALSTANLAAMLYFIFDTNKKEDAYLKETNKAFLEQKYSDYNSSYKVRNLLIGSYAALWIYSQIDLHFFNNALPNAEIDKTNTESGEATVSLSFRVPF